jgi:hypothetical protein
MEGPPLEMGVGRGGGELKAISRPPSPPAMKLSHSAHWLGIWGGGGGCSKYQNRRDPYREPKESTVFLSFLSSLDRRISNIMLVEESRWSLGQTLQTGHGPLFESPVYTVEAYGHDEILVRFSQSL